MQSWPSDVKVLKLACRPRRNRTPCSNVATSRNGVARTLCDLAEDPIASQRFRNAFIFVGQGARQGFEEIRRENGSLLLGQVERELLYFNDCGHGWRITLWELATQLGCERSAGSSATRSSWRLCRFSRNWALGFQTETLPSPAIGGFYCR